MCSRSWTLSNQAVGLLKDELVLDMFGYANTIGGSSLSTSWFIQDQQLNCAKRIFYLQEENANK